MQCTKIKVPGDVCYTLRRKSVFRVWLIEGHYDLCQIHTFHYMMFARDREAGAPHSQSTHKRGLW